MDFEAQFVITERCNLRCNYCYMDKYPTTMSIDTFDHYFAKMDRMMRLYNSTTYNTVYFGGEPLLNQELIFHSLPIFQQDKRCQQVTLITNGLLMNEELYQYLSSFSKCKISLSFDGIWQDLNRPSASGEKILHQYMEKKELLLKISKGFTKCMVGPPHMDLASNYQFLRDFGFTFIDFTIVRDDIWNEQDIATFEKELQHLLEVYKRDLQNGITIDIGLFTTYLRIFLFSDLYGKQAFTCYSGCRGMGLMPSGIGYACARFGSNKELPIYDVNTDQVITENYSLFDKQIIVRPKDFAKCKECILFNHCTSGCTHSQYLNQSEPLNSICILYKIIFREMMKLTHEMKDCKAFQKVVTRGLI